MGTGDEITEKAGLLAEDRMTSGPQDDILPHQGKI